MARGNGEAGVSLFEVLVVIFILGLSVGIASMNFEPLETPLEASATLIEGFMRQARLNAIVTTSAYRVSPWNSGRLRAETANSCSATSWTADNRMSLNLASGVALSSTSWSVCFSSRGISNENVPIEMHHSTYGTTLVEVLLGGTTRVVK